MISVNGSVEVVNFGSGFESNTIKTSYPETVQFSLPFSELPTEEAPRHLMQNSRVHYAFSYPYIVAARGEKVFRNFKSLPDMLAFRVV